MPSAAAVKVEKIPLFEDPGKQFLQMLDKKQRNLEKRKIKLDNYRHDVESGKELNEDQKSAVSKYDSVIQLLDFTKELTKAVASINQESGRQQKKQAKKEQVERQQLEIQRLKEALLYCHFLSCFQNEDVRSDFLNGENGALQLTSEQLSQLTQLYKIIGPELPSDQSDIENHFHVLAENHIFLVEGRNKEIAGTTYKALKELLQSIKACGYFSRPTESVDDETSSDDMPEELETPEIVADVPVVANGNKHEQPVCENGTVYETEPVVDVTSDVAVPAAQTGPLQEVLSTQGNFNFLQESQIDIDAPHMDPAVVAVHQIAPPASNFPAYSSPEVPPMTNGTHHEPTPVSPTKNSQPVLAAVPADFDPLHPIPTQTFTNQSFAVMQNMMPYVPVTMPLGTMAPIAVVSAGSMMPVAVAVAPVPGAEGLVEVQIEPEMVNCELTSNSTETPNDKVQENNGFNGYRNNFRGRGRGRGGGFYRGRNNYHNNNGRGGYQNNYYQDRNGYNPNYRRGNNRGGPRGGGGGGNGVNNHRGRGGNYNRPPNTQQHAPQQQQAPQPQQA